MKALGRQIGAQLAGGEVLELCGDIGAGKTTLAKGIAVGMGIDETVQSPTFTISRVYTAARGLELAHYDFYRLSDAGIMMAELAERLDDERSVVLVEWADVVQGALPADRLRVTIAAVSETERIVEIAATGTRSQRLLERLA